MARPRVFLVQYALSYLATKMGILLVMFAGSVPQLTDCSYNLLDSACKSVPHCESVPPASDGVHSVCHFGLDCGSAISDFS